MKKLLKVFGLLAIAIFAAMFTACKKEAPTEVPLDELGFKFNKEIVAFGPTPEDWVKLKLHTNHSSDLDGFNPDLFIVKVKSPVIGLYPVELEEPHHHDLESKIDIPQEMDRVIEIVETHQKDPGKGEIGVSLAEASVVGAISRSHRWKEGLYWTTHCGFGLKLSGAARANHHYKINCGNPPAALLFHCSTPHYTHTNLNTGYYYGVRVFVHIWGGNPSIYVSQAQHLPSPKWE